jgi:serine/threonine protein kinase
VIDQSDRKHHKDFKDTECDEVTLVLAPAAPAMLAGVVETWRQVAKEPQTFLACCIQQIASGLAYMHDQRVIHHDIKPDNIALISISPVKVVIIDLGHAEKQHQSTNHHLGTLRYLAPEVMLLKTKQSTQSFSFGVDVWSLGVTVLELLSARRISWDTGSEGNRDKLEELLRQHHSSSLAQFRLLSYKMLVSNPNERISASDVEDWLKDQFPEEFQGSQDPIKRRRRDDDNKTSNQRIRTCG